MRANKPALAPLKLILAAGLCVSALTACQTMPQTLAGIPVVGEIVAPPLAPTADLPPPAARTWPDAAQDVLNQRARGYGLAHMPELQQYLDGLLTRIKARAGVPEWPGKVYILATPALEAYATAAGNIYLSPSWVSEAQSEDEIVALLSHEFGHAYLHYHQLEGAVQDADQVAQYAALGVALAKKTGQATGWNQVDSLVTAYTMGRALTTAAWGRGQESAADAFGLNLSLKLGYSYEHGMKVFLERLASWEESNAERQAALKAQLLEQVKQEASAKALANQRNTAGNPLSSALAEPLSGLNAGIAGALFQSGEAAKGIIEATTSTHPQILARLDAVARAAESLPDDIANREATTDPLVRAQKDKRTAALFKNYQLAAQVMVDPAAPEALKLARQAASGPSARHALPLLALYRAQQAQPATGKRRKDDTVANLLDTNLKSEQDRAWVVYMERSTQLEASGQRKAATRLMDEGLAYFDQASDVWPQAIEFYGQTAGWDQAKKMAQSCNGRFKSMAAACTSAAATPQERAEQARKSEEKSEQLVNKLFKKN